jgi:hypothetical protein
VHCPPSRAKLPKKKRPGHASWQTLVLVAGPGRLAGGPKAGVSSSPWYRRFSLQALRGFCSQAKQQQDTERERERDGERERERERERSRERTIPTCGERETPECECCSIVQSSCRWGGASRGGFGKGPRGSSRGEGGAGFGNYCLRTADYLLSFLWFLFWRFVVGETLTWETRLVCVFVVVVCVCVCVGF